MRPAIPAAPAVKCPVTGNLEFVYAYITTRELGWCGFLFLNNFFFFLVIIPKPLVFCTQHATAVRIALITQKQKKKNQTKNRDRKRRRSLRAVKSNFTLLTLEPWTHIFIHTHDRTLLCNARVADQMLCITTRRPKPRTASDDWSSPRSTPRDGRLVAYPGPSAFPFARDTTAQR